jgi:regulator of protease activity HflC (stomatin/prohibitin superfamily)
MGGALPLGIIFLVILILVVLAAVFVVVPWSRKETAHTSELLSEDTETLEYRVPEGQDPAAVVAALRQDGLDATSVLRDGEQRVLIGSQGGGIERIRARARAVINHQSAMNLEDDPGPDSRVRFVDE